MWTGNKCKFFDVNLEDMVGGRKNGQEVSWKESIHKERRLFSMVGVLGIILHNGSCGAECPNEVSAVYRQVWQEGVCRFQPMLQGSRLLIQSGLLETVAWRRFVFRLCVLHPIPQAMVRVHPGVCLSNVHLTPWPRSDQFLFSSTRLSPCLSS